MTINSETESKHERQSAFWVLVLAVVGTIGLSMLGLALFGRLYS
jgi:Trk-type K+ transport system membrane component